MNQSLDQFLSTQDKDNRMTKTEFVNKVWAEVTSRSSYKGYLFCDKDCLLVSLVGELAFDIFTEHDQQRKWSLNEHARWIAGKLVSANPNKREQSLSRLSDESANAVAKKRYAIEMEMYKVFERLRHEAFSGPVPSFAATKQILARFAREQLEGGLQ